jgi:dihydroflavonol-4-reductase
MTLPLAHGLEVTFVQAATELAHEPRPIGIIMRAFVTGATGLLGTNLVRLLLEQGHEVRALARSRDKAEAAFGGLGVETVAGDMEDVPAFANALGGCDALFHTAAYFREYYQPGDHWPILERINVRATIDLLTEAARRGVKTGVHTSSSGVIGPGLGGAPGNESSPPPREAQTNLYFKSKVLAEEAIQAWMARQTGMRVVLVLPGWMFGPADAGPTGSGKLVLDFLAGKVPGIVDGGACIVDARDVAQAMIAAAERGEHGSRYIVAGEYHTLEDVMKTLQSVSGIPAPTRHIPYPAILIYAWFAELGARITGRAPTVSLQGVRAMHAKHRVSSDKATRELGATFRPLAETLRDEVEWFRQRGSTQAVTLGAGEGS